jgi:hypothetical protein
VDITSRLRALMVKRLLRRDVIRHQYVITTKGYEFLATREDYTS